MRLLIVFFLASSCVKSEEPLQQNYVLPDIDWEDDVDLDDLPEAGDTGEDEESLR